MKIEQVMNLCDILWNYEGISQIENVKPENCQRIYVGSYFCQNYLLSLREYPMAELYQWCRQQDVQITLVVPICSQVRLRECKSLIRELCRENPLIDEICINDVGMLDYVSANFEQKIFLGRLFMKEQRDPRNSRLRFDGHAVECLDAMISQLMLQYEIAGIEYDKIYHYMKFPEKLSSYIVGIHTPYAYITTGRMCMYAGMHKQDALQFEADAGCQMECRKKRICFTSPNGFFMKIGRTVYYPSVPCDYEFSGCIREIYWPCE